MPTTTATKSATRIRRSPMEHPSRQYPAETEALQAIAQTCGLSERIKWGKPCYLHEGRNIVLLQRFNDYIALMFFKGALLKDPGKLLFRVGEHMQAPRQLRFRSVAEVEQHEPVIRAFIQQAIELVQSGAKVPRKSPEKLAMPEELQSRLDTNPRFKAAFAALTPGRRKSYIYQIAAAKLPATRASRVEKFTPGILAGKGLND